MGRTLWLLTFMNWKGHIRRIGRSMRSPKGIALTLLGLGAFALWLAPMLIVMPRPSESHVGMVRRYMPTALLAYLVLGLLSRGTGERAIAFSPAEVNILFPGPFRHRQLILYKVVNSILMCGLSGLLMATFLAQHSPSFLAAAVGLSLSLALLQLVFMTVQLAADTVGVMAYNRRRKALLIGMALLAAVAAGPLVGQIRTANWWELLSQIQSSTAMTIASAPFVPFVRAFTASRIWPDLIGWTAASVAIDAALVGLIVLLDARNLEASAAASEAIYAKLERAKRTGSAFTPWASARSRKGLPMPPRWRGVGPVVWRQLSTARREFGRLLLALCMLIPISVPLIVGRSEGASERLVGLFAGVLAMLSFLLTSMLPFDFRGDYDRMAELKTLPIGSVALTIGQIATPVLCLLVIQSLVSVLAGVLLPGALPLMAAVLAIGLPFALLLVEVDNLLFLLFPMKATPGVFSLQAVGQAMLTMFAKFVCLAIAAGAAASVGFGVYYLTGSRLVPTVVAAWLVLAIATLPLIPLIARLFERFDVARVTPE